MVILLKKCEINCIHTIKNIYIYTSFIIPSAIKKITLKNRHAIEHAASKTGKENRFLCFPHIAWDGPLRRQDNNECMFHPLRP